MSAQVGEGQPLNPYLNPQYWDGHTLGLGAVQENPVTGLTSGTEWDFAKASVTEQIHGNSRFAIKAFRAGDVFDATRHAPGTIVLFREETLHGPEVSAEDLAALEDQPLPPIRPTLTLPGLGPRSPFVARQEGRHRYISHVRLGVVPQNNNGDHINSTTASTVLVNRQGVSRSLAPFTKTAAPIVIGETIHTAANRATPEQLRRVNILHLVTNGMPELHKRRIFSFTGRIASNN